MDARRQFLELIRDHPEDDTPRLIYADWLDEQGDLRGEFIRVQCELAKLSCRDMARLEMDRIAKLENREQCLLKMYQKEWTGSLNGFQVRRTNFHRGFLEDVNLIYERHPLEVPSKFTEHWKTLIEQEPALERVGLYLYRDWNDIQQLQFAPQIKALHFNYQALARREVSILLRWPIVRGLTSLDLSHNNLRSGVECVAHAPTLDGLEKLDLSFNSIGNRGARALASSSYLQGLRSLDLRGNSIGRDGKQKLRIAFGSRVKLVGPHPPVARGRSVFCRPTKASRR